MHKIKLNKAEKNLAIGLSLERYDKGRTHYFTQGEDSMINKAILIGNMTAEPEQRFSQGGGCVSNFCVACTEKWKDKQGQQQEKTEFLNCVAFGRLGEIIGEYCHKGSKVYIEGRNTIEKWEDKDGNKRYSHKIVAREMKMLDSRGGSGGQQGERQQQNSAYSPSPSQGMGDDVPF